MCQGRLWWLIVLGFDETFPKKPGGEDIDFGYRLYKKGYLLTTNPEALVYHATETWNTISQVVSRLFNWGKAELYLFERHPEFIRYECPKSWGLALDVAEWVRQLTFIIYQIIPKEIELVFNWQ